MLHLTRKIYSETRFLSPPRNRVSATNVASHPKDLFRNPVSQPPQKPGFCDKCCISPERFIQKPGFSEPPETGFLRQMLHLSRKIYSETRFLRTQPLAQDKFRYRQIHRRRHLQIRLLPLHNPHRQPASFKQSRIIRHFPTQRAPRLVTLR